MRPTGGKHYLLRLRQGGRQRWYTIGRHGDPWTADAESDDEGVAQLIVAGDAHFAEARHPMDQSMTPEMKDKMTREYMKKED